MRRQSRLAVSASLFLLAFALLGASPRAAELPEGWTGADVGSGGGSGRSSYSRGRFTLRGGGVWHANPDRFHYVYRTYSGDFQITAKLQRLSYVRGTDNPSAGLMLREDLDPTARFVSVLQSSLCDPSGSAY